MIPFALTATGLPRRSVGGESTYRGHSYNRWRRHLGSRTQPSSTSRRSFSTGLIDRLQAGDRLTLIEVYQADASRRDNGLTAFALQTSRS